MPLFAESVSPAASPLLGVLIFILGGLAGASFIRRFKKVKNWAWESYWLIFAWCLPWLSCPWVLAFCTSPDVIKVLHAAAPSGLAAAAAWILLPVRGDVGRRRAHLGVDDPLPWRRSRVGHRLRHLFRRGLPARPARLPTTVRSGEKALRLPPQLRWPREQTTSRHRQSAAAPLRTDTKHQPSPQ